MAAGKRKRSGSEFSTKAKGQLWTVRVQGNVGPDWPKDTRAMAVIEDRLILLRENLPPSEFLECAIHEMLHAFDPHKAEELVTREAEELAVMLHRLGFRRKATPLC